MVGGPFQGRQLQHRTWRHVLVLGLVKRSFWTRGHVRMSSSGITSSMVSCTLERMPSLPAPRRVVRHGQRRWEMKKKRQLNGLRAWARVDSFAAAWPGESRQKGIVEAVSLPWVSWMEKRSGRVWVGCWLEPSPPLMTGTGGTRRPDRLPASGVITTASV